MNSSKFRFELFALYDRKGGKMKKIMSAFLCFIMMLYCLLSANAENKNELSYTLSDLAELVYTTTPNPCVGAIGGEWAVLGLARSGEKISQEFYQRYYENVENYVKERSGVLHDKKYTEYSRVILALTAIGKNPADVAGYNLLLPLGDFEKTTWQGINGPIWALIALDSKNYEIPQNENAKVQATRNMYVEYTLDAQKSDGGWSLLQSASSSDVDITAMAVQALSKYCSSKNVEEAVKKALIMLKNTESSTCESAAQTLTALCALGEKYHDTQFLQKVTGDVLSYKTDKGFMHMRGGAADPMATEQALYSLAALKRFENGEPSLYTMSDALKTEESADWQQAAEKLEVKTFDDIKNHKNKAEIEALAARGIINGKSEESFDPENTMTRAEFATIIVKALQLTAKNTVPFEDVAQNDWFYTYVNAAYENGIVNGVSEKHFNPHGTITKQEAAVMLSRSANILKMNTQMELMAARDILAGFTDYVKTEQWAIIELAFCYDKGIIESEEMEISPKKAVKRCEIAQMVYNLLGKANMI